MTVKAWHARVPGVPTHTIVLGGPTITVRFDTTLAKASSDPTTGVVVTDLVRMSLDARCSDPAHLPAGVEAGDIAVATIEGATYLLILAGSIDTRIRAAVDATGEKVRFNALELVDVMVRRETVIDTNDQTGSPDVTVSTFTIQGHFAWRSPREDLDYNADTDATLTTLHDDLQQGDHLTLPAYGSFSVLSGGVKPLGGIDRVEVKRA